MKRNRGLLLLAAILFLLSACAGDSAAPEDEVHQVGEKISTAFFDYTVTETASLSRFDGRRAESGDTLVTVSLTIKNTQQYALPMGRYDFRLQWGEDGEHYVYPLEQYSDAQLPDSYDIPEGESAEGVLVFQVPEETRDLALGFLEIFEDDTQGQAFYIYFTI